MFEGYAGTSASGFAAEVAAEEAVAMLDYVEDLYRDWNTGAQSGGGAAERINAEFQRIRRELGDLPCVVSDELRLRTMLRHLTKTLHPGVLNDCFFNAATAVCVKRAKVVGRPVPQHNMCLRCPNARRSTVHRPRLAVALREEIAALKRERKQTASDHAASVCLTRAKAAHGRPNGPVSPDTPHSDRCGWEVPTVRGPRQHRCGDRTDQSVPA
jgi:hypothetical protein